MNFDALPLVEPRLEIVDRPHGGTAAVHEQYFVLHIAEATGSVKDRDTVELLNPVEGQGHGFVHLVDLFVAVEQNLKLVARGAHPLPFHRIARVVLAQQHRSLHLRIVYFAGKEAAQYRANPSRFDGGFVGRVDDQVNHGVVPGS